MRNESGFTLIEIVVSLVLVGMMAAIAGMGIVTGTKGYLLAKENSHMAQKAQIAMARIQRELMELTGIAARQADPAFIIYDNTTGRHAIARDGVYVKMYDLTSGATDLPLGAGDILIDNVNNFTLDYFQGAIAWGGVDIRLLSAIQADLALDRSDGSGDTVTFTTTVNPRNTNNYGGVPPTAIPNTAHNYTCFVATAASDKGSVSPILLFCLVIAAVLLLNHFFVTQRQKRKGAEAEVRSQKTEGMGGWKVGRLGENKGNVLIGLIVTMMIFAALGAGMVAMTGTSTSSQVTANTTSKAYYLAESGFRYLASQYLNEGDTDTDGEIEDDRNQVLINHHGQIFTLINPDERFNLNIRPYYLVTTGLFPGGSMTIGTMFAGQSPTDFTMPASGGRLNIGNNIYTYGSYSDITGIITIPAGLAQAVGTRMNVLLVGIPAGAGNMNNGGDLTLANASFFPAITGKFMINGIAYTYQTKNGNTLENITDANQPNRVFSLPVDVNTNLILRPYLRVRSTGTVGQGDQAASREIVYNVSIPDSPTHGERVVFHDTFETTDAWEASTWGTHEVQNISGGNALRVTGTQAVSGAPKASLIGLNWSSTDANLASAHSLSGYFLSYDAQVKVGFDSPFTPGSWSDGYEEGNGPDGLPKYYAAGLSFRLDQNNNSYGVSFLRGSSSTPPTPDNIDSDIVPQDQIPMIVLWQQTNSGEDREWLAYKYLTGPVLFSDDMESGAPGWDNTTFAHNQWTLSSSDSHSPSNCWSDSPGNYDNDENSWLITPLQNFPGLSSAVLTFWHKHSFEDGYDFAYVDISTDNGNTWNPIPLATYTGHLSNWEKVAIDISEYLPNITIRFRIQTDSSFPFDGWYIDDVAISEGFPVNESTLLVRIKEAAELRFDSGGTTPIEDGDIINQGSAQGTVVGNPIVSAGSWAAGNAEGIITINKVSGTFINGALLVGGSNLATCTSFTARNNYIKVFYGDKNGYGTANNDPFDLERLPNLRNEVHWPTDEIADWSAERDFFTLVRWDGVNSVDIIDSIDEPDVIILSDESTLFTPNSGILSFARPELGLHTFGHGSTNVYFDDFALQVEIASGSGFLTPIQE